MFNPPIGHSAAQTQLAQMLAGGKMPHALLLHGPQGIGKRTLANFLAARLICGGAGGLSPNQNSPQWHQLQAGSCPDFYPLTPESGKKSISIKQVQTLLENLQRSAETARVVILDALDDLTPEATNTLLKSLEEPRPGIFFLLLSHQLSRVLPTIRSRCRLLALTPLSAPATEQILAQNGLSASEITAWLPHLHGAPGLALLPDAAPPLAPSELLSPAALNQPQLLAQLQQHLAGQGAPTYQQVQAYFTLLRHQHNQAEFNLPSNLVNAVAQQVTSAATPKA
jgi:DNA polymerase III delta' subunit